MLEKERAYFEAHLSEWLKTESNKFVVITGDSVIGFFSTIEEALTMGTRSCGLNPFLVRRIEKQNENISIPALTLGLLNANFTFST